MTHVTDRLAEYVAGTLSPAAATEVERHLSRCAACRQDAAGWHRVAGGVRARLVPAPTTLFTAIRGRLASAAPASGLVIPPAYQGMPGGCPAARAVGILAHQGRLVGWWVWVVCVALLAGGTALAARVPESAEPAFAVIVPSVAAFAVAVACGLDEPADELVRAAPTSVRTILLARLTLVLGVIVAVSAICSLGVGVTGEKGPSLLLAAWLGPMSLLAAASFACSVVWRSAGGLSAALVLWGVRAMAASGLLDGAVAEGVAVVWRTSWPTLGVACAVVAGAVLAAPHLPPPRGARFGA